MHYDFHPGGVYSIPDEYAVFPDAREERAEGKGVKNTRYVVVLQDDAAARDGGYSRLLVAPFTTLEETELGKGVNDIPVDRGEGGLTDDCYCLLGHIFPILKDDIKNYHGLLPATRVEGLQSVIASIFGLVKDDAYYGLE
ncbi:MAG: type II toxin-antitoxin system PemK/MazF family toxin [Coriobacteriia bacterium]|nr:type II toxin-antitoxin system PemK/MazF family toxin [Coriobacteriia bacterium]